MEAKELLMELLAVVVGIAITAASAYLPILIKRLSKKAGIELTEAEEAQFERIVVDHTSRVDHKNDSDHHKTLNSKGKKQEAVSGIVEDLIGLTINRTEQEIDIKVEAVLGKYGNKLGKFIGKL